MRRACVTRTTSPEAMLSLTSMVSVVLPFDSVPPHPMLRFWVTLKIWLSHPLVSTVPAGAFTVTVVSEVSPPVADTFSSKVNSTAVAAEAGEESTGAVTLGTLWLPGVTV